MIRGCPFQGSFGLGGRWAGDGVCKRVCKVKFLSQMTFMDGRGGMTVVEKGLSTRSVH